MLSIRKFARYLRTYLPINSFHRLAKPVFVTAVDIDTGELPAQVILFDVNVQTITTITSSALGDGTVETLDLGGVCGVYVVMIDFYGDAAFDNFELCIGGEVEVCDGEDNDGDGDIDEGCTGDDDDDDDDGEEEEEEEEEEEDETEPDCSMAGDRAGSAGLSLFLLLSLTFVGVGRRNTRRD